MPTQGEKAARGALILAFFTLNLHLILGRTFYYPLFEPLVALSGYAFAVTLLAMLRLQLARRADEERRDAEAARMSGEDSARLFNDGENASLLPAVRTQAQFENSIIPWLTPVLAGWLMFAAWQAIRALWAPAPMLSGALLPVAFLAGQGMICYVAGRYLSALARPNQPILAGPAGALGLTSTTAFLAMAGVLALIFRMPIGQTIVHAILAVVLALIALELTWNSLSLLYRTAAGRRKARAYESRIAGLLSRPTSVLGDVAQALDYQFGFQVSGSWFYRLCASALLPVVALQIVLLAASSCVIFLEPHETGFRERMGRADPARTALASGLHFKWPSPFERIRRLPTGRVLETHLGFAHEGTSYSTPTAYLWTVPHYEKEDLFLTAIPGQDADSSAVPVGLLSVNLPVLYRITNAWDYAYTHANPDQLLRDVTYRQLTRLFIGSSLSDLVGEGQLNAAARLRISVQSELDRLRSGLHIEFLGLQGAHPPMQTAEAFEAVVGALQEKETAILQARAYAEQLVPGAKALAASRISRAETYRHHRQVVQQATAAHFHLRRQAWAASPLVYETHHLLSALESSLREPRKIILTAPAKHSVFTFDLEPPPDPSLFEFHDAVGPKESP